MFSIVLDSYLRDEGGGEFHFSRKHRRKIRLFTISIDNGGGNKLIYHAVHRAASILNIYLKCSRHKEIEEGVLNVATNQHSGMLRRH